MSQAEYSLAAAVQALTPGLSLGFHSSESATHVFCMTCRFEWQRPATGLQQRPERQPPGLWRHVRIPTAAGPAATRLLQQWSSAAQQPGSSPAQHSSGAAATEQCWWDVSERQQQQPGRAVCTGASDACKWQQW